MVFEDHKEAMQLLSGPADEANLLEGLLNIARRRKEKFNPDCIKFLAPARRPRKSFTGHTNSSTPRSSAAARDAKSTDEPTTEGGRLSFGLDPGPGAVQS